MATESVSAAPPAFRKKLLVLGTAISTIVLILVSAVHIASNDPELSGSTTREDYHRQRLIYLPKESEGTEPILVWWSQVHEGSRASRYIKDCSRGSCLFTPSRTELDSPRTAGFLFHGTFILWDDLPLPRRSDHLWFLLHEESPKNNWLLATDEGISLFNTTATPSRYSNFPLTTLYLPSVQYLLAPSRYAAGEKSAGGLSIANYAQSDCDVPSDRDAYVEELMLYMDIDSYGACLHNKDLPEHIADPSGWHADDFLQLLARYKFTFVFENSVCEDYVTEKLWRPLSVGSVPVIGGSESVRDWLPSNKSAVLVSDFDSPQSLAYFLKSLASNDEEYNKYLSWKADGITNDRLLQQLKNRSWREGKDSSFVSEYECFACNSVHDRKHEYKHLSVGDSAAATREDSAQGSAVMSRVADKRHFNCSSPKSSVHLGIWGLLWPGRTQRWVENEDCSRRKAKVIHDLVARNASKLDCVQDLRKHDFRMC